MRLTNQEHNDLMATALEGGINYWCNSATVVEEDQHKVKEDDLISDAFARGCRVTLEVDGGDDVTISKEDLQRAFDKYREKQGVVFPLDDYDVFDADALIQLAVFDEIVYG